jgi:hypothetical protein
VCHHHFQEVIQHLWLVIFVHLQQRNYCIPVTLRTSIMPQVCNFFSVPVNPRTSQISC